MPSRIRNLLSSRLFRRSILAEQSAERARQLVQSDVIGTAELQKREAEVLQTGAEVAALRAQLRGLGMSDEAIQQLEETNEAELRLSDHRIDLGNRH